MKIRDNFLCDLNNTNNPDLKAFLYSRYKLYRNRIVAIPYSLTNLFADDTMLLIKSKSLKSLAKMVNIDLKCLINWLKANIICLNSKKSELLLLHPSRKSNILFDFKIKINGRRLYLCESVKYLGIVFDSSFNWDSHISSVCKKLARANGVLSKLRYYVSHEVILSLYYSLFHSHLSYSTNAWAVLRSSILK